MWQWWRRASGHGNGRTRGYSRTSLPYGLSPPVKVSVAVAWPLTPDLSFLGRYWKKAAPG